MRTFPPLPLSELQELHQRDVIAWWAIGNGEHRSGSVLNNFADACKLRVSCPYLGCPLIVDYRQVTEVIAKYAITYPGD